MLVDLFVLLTSSIFPVDNSCGIRENISLRGLTSNIELILIGWLLIKAIIKRI